MLRDNEVLYSMCTVYVCTCMYHMYSIVQYTYCMLYIHTYVRTYVCVCTVCMLYMYIMCTVCVQCIMN